MIVRAIALAAGIAGGAGLSQFPEFSQQYLQRLSGAVDELRGVVTAFDVAATAAGLSREEALAELQGTDLTNELRQNIAGTVARYDRLSADYQHLRDAGPITRLAQPWNLADRTLLNRTWDDFRPAIPVTLDGLICSGIGFLAGWLAASTLLGLFFRPFRRKNSGNLRPFL